MQAFINLRDSFLNNKFLEIIYIRKNNPVMKTACKPALVFKWTTLLFILIYFPSCTASHFGPTINGNIYSMEMPAKFFMDNYEKFDMSLFTFKKPMLSNDYVISGEFVSGTARKSITLSKEKTSTFGTVYTYPQIFDIVSAKQFIADLKKEGIDLKENAGAYKILLLAAPATDYLSNATVSITLYAIQSSSGTRSATSAKTNPCPPCGR